MDKMTFNHLGTTPWYRLLKVVYFGAFLLVLLYWNALIFDFGGTATYNLYNYLYDSWRIAPYVYDASSFFRYFIIGNLLIAASFEVIRRVFYYILLGTFKPRNS